MLNLPLVRKRSDRGFTIVELLIAVALGLLLTAIVSAIYIGNRQSTVTQRDLSYVTQSGAFAEDIVSRMLRQAGHIAVDGTATGVDEATAPPAFCGQAKTPDPAPSIMIDGGPVEGFDAKAPAGDTVVSSSDMVYLRFYGSSAQTASAAADGSITDCFGKAVKGPLSGTGGAGRSWVKLYVKKDTGTGNPALYCTQFNAGEVSSQTQALVDGVESFQLLYGVGARYEKTGASPAKLTATSAATEYRILTEKYLPASQMTLADWNNVISVRFGLMVSGDAPNSRGSLDTKTDYNLFGSGYATTNGASFDSTNSASLEAARRNRLRQVFATTVELKNAPLYTSCPPA